MQGFRLSVYRLRKQGGSDHHPAGVSFPGLNFGSCYPASITLALWLHKPSPQTTSGNSSIMTQQVSTPQAEWLKEHLTTQVCVCMCVRVCVTLTVEWGHKGFKQRKIWSVREEQAGSAQLSHNYDLLLQLSPTTYTRTHKPNTQTKRTLGCLLEHAGAYSKSAGPFQLCTEEDTHLRSPENEVKSDWNYRPKTVIMLTVIVLLPPTTSHQPSTGEPHFHTLGQMQRQCHWLCRVRFD